MGFYLLVYFFHAYAYILFFLTNSIVTTAQCHVEKIENFSYIFKLLVLLSFVFGWTIFYSWKYIRIA